MANRLTVFDLNVNVKGINKLMSQETDDPIQQVVIKHAKQMYHIARASAEAVLFMPDMLPVGLKVTPEMERKAVQVLKGFGVYEEILNQHDFGRRNA